ncbi:hypothetical protein CEXT_379431, partial [Caerostris extrusa]
GTNRTKAGTGIESACFKKRRLWRKKTSSLRLVCHFTLKEPPSFRCREANQAGASSPRVALSSAPPEDGGWRRHSVIESRRGQITSERALCLFNAVCWNSPLSNTVKRCSTEENASRFVFLR